ncbi:MAG: 50S ribosomal protein L11 methyltransferase [Desulfomonile tiedjei]|nr:50S ribosomal protein L11 methyltransferase [Desulfomonile tiedjei]
MISPDDMLFIYEIRGEVKEDVFSAPSSYVGRWNEEEFSYLFFTAPENNYVNSLISAQGGILSSRHEMRYRDWQTGVPPAGLAVGSVVFVSADHPAPPSGSLLLDPSVVFGDGSHPTTVSCLRFMEEIIRTRSITSMLDLGTGSGILALAAAALGVERITAVDRNHLAALTARENVRLNSLASKINVVESELRLFVDEPFDLITANLPFSVLRDLVPLKGVPLHKTWIVSGIDAPQSEVLIELFSDQGFELLGQHSDPPWVTFVTVNKCLGY